MPSAADDISIHVEIAPDKSQAALTVPAEMARDMVTPQACLVPLHQENIEVTNRVTKAVDAMIADLPPEGEPFTCVVAEATQPLHGVDGRVEWLDAGEQESSSEGTNFYEHSAFVMVERGQVIGKVHEPTPGTDGRDILGKTLAAKEGKPVKVQFDESIMCDASGDLIAQQEGVLSRSFDKAAIRQMIEIDDYVDFSTGNIDFNGEVLIKKGVRDCFIVKATGKVQVRGLIEAATIDCGGDLVAEGGFAGRERGTALIGGNLCGRYLDNIQGEVRGDLCIDRETINCDLTIHGAVASSHGAIIGGTLAITGRVDIGTIGSGAGVETRLILDSVPRLEPPLQELGELISELEVVRDARVEEQDRINLDTRRLTADDKERQTEIMFELAGLNEGLARAQAVYEALRVCIAEQRTLDVNVQRKLNQGAVLVIGDTAFKMNTELRGPVQICRQKGDIVYKRAGGQATLLAQLADIT